MNEKSKPSKGSFVFPVEQHVVTLPGTLYNLPLWVRNMPALREAHGSASMEAE